MGFHFQSSQVQFLEFACRKSGTGPNRWTVWFRRLVRCGFIFCVESFARQSLGAASNANAATIDTSVILLIRIPLGVYLGDVREIWRCRVFGDVATYAFAGTYCAPA